MLLLQMEEDHRETVRVAIAAFELSPGEGQAGQCPQCHPAGNDCGQPGFPATPHQA